MQCIKDIYADVCSSAASCNAEHYVAKPCQFLFWGNQQQPVYTERSYTYIATPISLCFKRMKFDFLNMWEKRCLWFPSQATNGFLNCGTRNRAQVRKSEFLCLSARSHTGSLNLSVYDLLNTYPGNHTQKIKKWIVQLQRALVWWINIFHIANIASKKFSVQNWGVPRGAF